MTLKQLSESVEVTRNLQDKSSESVWILMSKSEDFIKPRFVFRTMDGLLEYLRNYFLGRPSSIITEVNKMLISQGVGGGKSPIDYSSLTVGDKIHLAFQPSRLQLGVENKIGDFYILPMIVY